MTHRMNKVILFGNSGSGKSTLAKKLTEEFQLVHLDLDTLAWQATDPPSRKPFSESKSAIESFMTNNSAWVIEGCYVDLLSIAAAQAQCAIFMDLSVPCCQKNAQNRPWEPHKYASEAEQDANLEMLLGWIADYKNRTDEFSYLAHQELFRSVTCARQRITENQPCVPLIG